MQNWPKISSNDIELRIFGRQKIYTDIPIIRPENCNIAEFIKSAESSDKEIIGLFGPNHRVLDNEWAKFVCRYFNMTNADILYSDHSVDGLNPLGISHRGSKVLHLSPVFFKKASIIDCSHIKYNSIDSFLNSVVCEYIKLNRIVVHIPEILFSHENTTN